MSTSETAAQETDIPAPLAGIRVLALEQMQALPYATQLLGRLGADVVKIESPQFGDQGRSSMPAISDPDGRSVGATFLRNNLGKRSVCVDLKDPRGRDLVLALAPSFDIVAENFKPGTAERLGLDYQQIRAVHPACIYVSVSGFGNTVETPYRTWPAFSTIVEAMSGIYEIKRPEGDPPITAPVGALADIGAALFATIGIMGALRQRDATGEGQYVDVAMYDSVVAMTDIVMNFWSLGLRHGATGPLIMHGFWAGDGWITIQIGRELQFAHFAKLVGHPEWTSDARFATRQGWVDHLDDVLRPAVRAWAEGLTRLEACQMLSKAGIASGPCLTDEEVVRDTHLMARKMIVEIHRTDGVDQPVLLPGNPVKLRGTTDDTVGRVPWLGEHTREVLASELGLTGKQLARLQHDGVVN
jgi:crotonobetainyl-CoA:carnitine CoA-transferase CaiB-like acyl-CoA transferase